MNWRPIRGWRKPLHERGMKAGRCQSDFSLVQDRHPASILSTRSCHLRLNHAPESACRWPQVFDNRAIRLRPMTLFNPVFNCLTPIVIKRSKTQADEGLTPADEAGSVVLRQPPAS